MKKLFTVATVSMLSISSYAYEDLECVDTQNESLTYSVKRIGKTENYLLTVKKGKKLIYKESLEYLDWQGEVEYKGPHSSLINSGEEILQFTHSGATLHSTELQCEVLLGLR